MKADSKTKNKIGRIVVETEMCKKHDDKRESRGKMRQLFEKIHEKMEINQAKL